MDINKDSDGLINSLKSLINSKEFKSLSSFRNKIITNEDISKILKIISDELILPNKTIIILNHVPNLILYLLSSVIEKSDINSNSQHREICIALGTLVEFHPDCIKFSQQYFLTHESPFYKPIQNLSSPNPKRRRKNPNSDLPLIKCCLSLLKCSPNFYRNAWNWNSFLKEYLVHENEEIRWYACECIALVTSMNDIEKQMFFHKYLKEKENIKFKIDYEANFKNRKHFKNINSSKNENTLVELNSESIVSVGGILLPKFKIKSKDSQSFTSTFVKVPSTLANLRSLALAITSGQTICLEGPVGSGKTSLVEYLAEITGRTAPPHFVKVQLGDQTDSRMLLGNYLCTDIPGEFIWQAGILAQAVENGHWLLLEDIDSAPQDVVSLLCSLSETGILSAPGSPDNLRTAPGFQLFITQRHTTGFQKHIYTSSKLLETHCLKINVEPLSKEELIEIIQTKYPKLKTIASRIVKVFLMFSVGKHENSLESSSQDTTSLATLNITSIRSRLISTRDLLKWCKRASINFDVKSTQSALNVFQDALDIFCGSFSTPETRIDLAKKIGACLGITEAKAYHFISINKPSISQTPFQFCVGRAQVKISEQKSLSSECLSYSFTRPAALLLESIACCVSLNEPVLLVGETGTGKTSTIQYLASRVGRKLVVINMNQQSDSADLLGGYKPVSLKHIIAPIREEFESLFRCLFNVQNANFLGLISDYFNNSRWNVLFELMRRISLKALKHLDKETLNQKEIQQKERWICFNNRLLRLEKQLKNPSLTSAFSFVEGSLVKALRSGDWILLDEINLASSETLECLSSLLEGPEASLYLLERGDKEPIIRNKDLRIFACMNPATDVGKKHLPDGLRNRFTEFFIDELLDKQDLHLLISSYLNGLSMPNNRINNLVEFYLKIKKETINSLTDGTGNKPHYSLRTLCRALKVAANNSCGSIPRSLYEGFCLSFLTQLDYDSHPKVECLVARAIVANKDNASLLTRNIPEPPTTKNKKYIQFEGYWVTVGSSTLTIPKKYILTKTVRRNLRDLVRVVSLASLPILLQGETSVGKTSLITYLAQSSGNHCVRVNNHDNTDLQEYIGAYSTNAQGQLVFQEGVLVEAMRKGHWIILDELNLAPSDVLEALNRVLDDNRELFVPETQEVIKAHPNFRLFATQNPPGLYGGRKILSRAFRNRFVELHFDEIPKSELETILHFRCDLPMSYSKKLVAIMSELQLRRRGSVAFAGKKGYITLRDLFRWGERYRLASETLSKSNYYDWDQHMADEGYLVLAGRVRKSEEVTIIKQALEKHFKRTVDPQKLFTFTLEDISKVTKTIVEKLKLNPPEEFKNIVWTYNMRRLAVLVGKSFEFGEPVLLVGPTGCGKTTVCQYLAKIYEQELYTVNCHMHTECSDFLGGMRPNRNRSTTAENKEPVNSLFEWVEGPLVQAMRSGGLFLADEISLADDSVLERLNSLLEPERTLLLSEKGINEDGSIIKAKDEFRFIGTMNPGGDFGKKELSAALRNRLTEIWCESCSDQEDLLDIIEHNLSKDLTFENPSISQDSRIGKKILQFLNWFISQNIGKRMILSLRDILSWVKFINHCTDKLNNENSGLDICTAYIQGACLVFLDGMGAGTTGHESLLALKQFRTRALNFLYKQMQSNIKYNPKNLEISHIESTEDRFGLPPFFISKGPKPIKESKFSFNVPTTGLNALRILRAMQINKPILLEGSPGVGKTSLIEALANASGRTLERINLSDQTDISDLFGADLPVEGGRGDEFAWRDGPFLQALKAGHWILLDELNLASQSVLEGLNACLDHRKEVHIPELGKTFEISQNTRLFGAQNPLNQGGSRRGLPQSFLNRFTQVFIDALDEKDLKIILKNLFPSLPHDLIHTMVQFNSRLVEEIVVLKKWGIKGSPWELNLRDLTRWCESLSISQNPADSLDSIYVDRMRTLIDKQNVYRVYREIFDQTNYPLLNEPVRVNVNQSHVKIGEIIMPKVSSNFSSIQNTNTLLLRNQSSSLRSLSRNVHMNWMTILVGASGVGKTSLVVCLSQLLGRRLEILPINQALDTSELIGGFHQCDEQRHLAELLTEARDILTSLLRQQLISSHIYSVPDKLESISRAFQLLDQISNAPPVKLDQLLLQASQLFSSLDPAVEKLFNSYKKTTSDDKGRFEWIDSTLVKCMKKGWWLLLDNANLCSPAVLDRLNGLLEPGGKLILGERGACEGEALQVVKPHQDFRIFIAMDPTHGELSRAMRNRGVEIALLDPLPLDETSQLDLDTRGLLTARGLSDPLLQNSLFAAHVAISLDGVSATLPQLLHAARLASQYLSIGESPINSLRSACIDVYVKSRIRLTSSAKQALRSRIENVLETYSAIEKTNTLALQHKFTLNTISLLDNSMFANICHYSALLMSCALAPKNTDTTCLKFISPTSKLEEPISISILIPHLLTITFSKISCAQELNMLYEWLSLVDESEFRTLIESFKNSISSFCENKSIALDSRWLGENPREVAFPNQIALLLRYIAQFHNKLKYNSINTNISSHIKRMTIAEYSDAVYQGSIPKKRIDNLLVDLFKPFIMSINKALYVIFSSNGTLEVDNEEWSQFDSALHWFDRFIEIGNLQLIKSDDKQLTNRLIDEAITSLSVHYRWIFKHLIPKIYLALEKQNNKDELDNLKSFCERINQELVSSYTFMNQKVRRLFGQPLPHSREEEAKLLQRLIEVNEKLNVWNLIETGEKLNNELIPFLGSDEGVEVRNIINEAFVALNDSNDFFLVEKLIEDVEKRLNSNLTNLTFQQRKKLECNIRMCPILELFSLRAILHSWSSSSEFSKVTATAIASGVSTLPPILSYQWKKEFTEPEVRAWILKTACSSIALQNPVPILTWKYPQNHEVEKYEFNQNSTKLSNYTIHSPLLAVAFSQVTLPNDTFQKRYSSTSLGSQNARLHQLKSIQRMLWRNSRILFNSSMDLNLNNAKCALNSAENFFKILDEAFEISQESNNFQEHSIILLNEFESLPDNKISLEPGFKSAFKSLAESADELASSLNEAEDQESSERLYLSTAGVWIWLGFLQANLFSHLGLIDPIQKKLLKLHYSEEEIKSLKIRIYSGEVDACVGWRDSNNTEGRLHPFLSEHDKRIKHLDSKCLNLRKLIAVRPEPPTFSEMSQELLHFIKTIASFKTISSIQKALAQAQNVEKSENWLFSQSVLWKRLLQRYYAWYPDQLIPVLTAQSQMCFGMQLQASHARVIIFKKKFGEKSLFALEHLLTYPSLGEQRNSIEMLVQHIIHTSNAIIPLLAMSEKSSQVLHSAKLRFELSALKELENYAALNMELSEDAWKLLEEIVFHISKVWRIQEDERLLKEQDEASMYKSSGASKGHSLSEEQILAQELNDLFPSDFENDFEDLKETTILDEKSEPSDHHTASTPLLVTPEILEIVASVHSRIVLLCTKTHWLESKEIKHKDRIDFLQPWLKRFEILSKIIPDAAIALPSSFENRLWPALCVLSSSQISLVSGESLNMNKDNDQNNIKFSSKTEGCLDKHPYDFYRDQNVQEALQCLPILEAIIKKVDELLIEWPDNIFLINIEMISQRIYSFPVDSPLSRFLTGLELLIGHLNDWEQNAHSGVSLASYSAEATRIIISWRKFELQCWKNSLTNTYFRYRAGAAKWWFHINDIVRNYPEERNSSDLIKALEKFIEGSSLGEFGKRLEIIYSFHCHCVHLPQSEAIDELSRIFWNIHSIYSQFIDIIEKKISEFRKPIEKKLKDFVKIAKWNDINYWAIREALAKTHRTIHKYVKEFETVLKLPVHSHLVIPQNNEPDKISKKQKKNENIFSGLDVDYYIASNNLKEYIIELSDDSLESFDILSKSKSLFLRSRELCTSLVRNSPYPTRIQNIEDLTTEIISTIEDLGSLETDISLPKDKQRSQAKNILQQKRKALADLFKMLNKIGINYRTGSSIYFTKEIESSEYNIPPLDLSALFSQNSKSSLEKPDSQLFKFWEKAEKYFYRSLARLALLEQQLQKNPSKDLGPSTIERCRGFSVHLKMMTLNQKKQICTSSQLLFSLRNYLTIISDLDSTTEMPTQTHLKLFWMTYKNMISNGETILNQFLVVLHSCPNNIETELQEPEKGKKRNYSNICLDDEMNNYSQEKINSYINQIENMISHVNKEKSNIKNSEHNRIIVTNKQYKFMIKGFKKLEDIANVIVELCVKFENIDEKTRPTNPLCSSLYWLASEFKKEAKNFNQTPIISISSDEDKISQFCSQANSLMNETLYIIQELFKKSTPLVNQDQDEDENETIEEQLLKEKILDNLEHDIVLLKMQKIERKLSNLITSLSEDYSSDHQKELIKVILRYLPILEQITLLYHYFFTQQIAVYRTTNKLFSVLLSLFINLSQKGFCIPPELDENCEEGEENGPTKGGMGLGEGEGEKDVSERIDSLDDLEEARPQGEEKKEDDRDCKEEENGVDMPEDFDGKTQDLDKPNSDDEEEDKDDENDLDKEMGETNNEADKLDKQIWGSDDEEEGENEDQLPEEEEKGIGEEMGESELGPKDDNQNKQNQEDEQENSEKKENKPEINEMKDQEQDDDQIDPYHGQQQPEPEIEPLDLPDDLQLDEGEAKDQEEANEEDPFDIDTMKELNPPLEENENEENETKEENPNNPDGDASDEDENNEGNSKETDEQMETEENEENPENEEDLDGDKLEEETNKDNEPPEEDKNKEEITASEDNPSEAPTESALDMPERGSKDQVVADPNEANQNKSEPQDKSECADEQAGVGQADSTDPNSGHQGEMSVPRENLTANNKENQENKKKRKRPGESDEDRTLGDTNQSLKKKLHTIDADKTEKEDAQEGETLEEKEEVEAEIYQHIKESKGKSDAEILDTATEEQFKQSVPNDPDQNAEEIEDNDVEMDSQEPEKEDDPNPELKSESVSDSNKQNKNNTKKIMNEEDKLNDIQTEGETVETLTVPRGSESNYFTVNELLNNEKMDIDINLENENSLNLESLMAPPIKITDNSREDWLKYSSSIENLARDLSEQLRLVLEPTKASKLRGDYRTGRRLNMRKVLQYIASQFRKDKIWLRRTKLSKREYQIVLAMDDSSSMSDNQSKQLAFESLALISRSLNLLEAGELAVLSFGEQTQILHNLGEPFGEHSGVNLIEQLTFQQRKTCVGQLLDTASSLLGSASRNSSSELAQLLIIVSDGCLFGTEGPETVYKAVQRARQQGIFIVFLIIDNPDSKHSIVDISTFKDDKLCSYLETFPFPFYLILKDITCLPNVLSDALRQWFELVTSVQN